VRDPKCVFAGQADIEQDDVDTGSRHDVRDAACAWQRGHAHLVVAKIARHQLEYLGVIVDRQNVHALGRATRFGQGLDARVGAVTAARDQEAIHFKVTRWRPTCSSQYWTFDWTTGEASRRASIRRMRFMVQ
jgi:hypothetical protein